ncbi:hypothetical protein [Microbacterium sp. 77mftsu3.1]|uniref:hypothetical protein n=1 Tax=Microbacterium sp. 77mftsu3.1 TaxID=1761802 RepID=UPI00037817CE|nr:hypothetical protein [Microbacterium sp. 77mftsu3.1]SDH55941.1 hypothetical protein SAMN04488590_3576 [Microbacterium sp. 77mftsu3.1]
MTTPYADALAAYNLAIDDLPGIRAAWETHFAELAEPRPEEPLAVLRRLLPGGFAWNDWDDLVIDSITPSASGDILVAVSGDWTDPDDEDANRYRDEDIHVPAQFVTEFLTAHENRAAISRYDALSHSQRQYATGASPIWWLLSEGKPAQALQTARSQRSIAARRHDTAAKTLAGVGKIRAALDGGSPLDAADFESVEFHSRGIKSVAVFDSHRNKPTIVTVREVNGLALDYAEGDAKATRLQSALTEARALPAGPLREFLVGERETQTTKVMEGKGRSRRLVTHTYTPRSDIVREAETAQANFARLVVRRNELLERLAFIEAEAAATVTAEEPNVTTADRAVEQAWAMGWPGVAPAPAPIAQRTETYGW